MADVAAAAPAPAPAAAPAEGDRKGFKGGFGGRGGKGGPKAGGRRGFEDEWIPQTKLGRLVQAGKIANLEEIFVHSLPIKEH